MGTGWWRRWDKAEGVGGGVEKARDPKDHVTFPEARWLPHGSLLGAVSGAKELEGAVRQPGRPA